MGNSTRCARTVCTEPGKLLVTSPDDGLIRNRLAAFPQVSIQAQDTAGDTKHYVASAVHDCIARRQLLHGKVSAELKNHILRILENKYHGLYVFISFSQNIRILKFTGFIWPRSQIAAICRQNNVRVALRNTPEEVEDSFKAAEQWHDKVVELLMLPCSRERFRSVDVNSPNFLFCKVFLSLPIM